jgi:hypothetical protein
VHTKNEQRLRKLLRLRRRGPQNKYQVPEERPEEHAPLDLQIPDVDNDEAPMVHVSDWGHAPTRPAGLRG